MNKLGITALLIALPAASSAFAALSAKDIMTKNEEARQINDVKSSAVLTTGGGGSPERVKSFTWWRKLTDDKIHFNTLTRFHAPAEIRGEGILFLERGDQNEVMMYLPNFKKIRRVESQQQSGSFMGSEFSYSDIATPHVDDYTYKLLKEEPCPGETGIKCHVIESTPATEAIKERTGYSKSVHWIRSDNFMGVKGEHHDAEGNLWKKLEASEIKEVDPAKHKWMSHRIRIENAKNGRFTLMQFSGVKVNQGIPDSTFTQQNLARDR